jgi:hypothetical protein
MSFSNLPTETMINILKYLSPKDLLQTSLVSKKFVYPSQTVLTFYSITTIRRMNKLSNVQFDSVRKIKFVGPIIDLKILRNFKRLEYLDVSNMILNTKKLEVLSEIKTLKVLDITNNRKITNDGVKIISTMNNLEKIFMTGIPVSSYYIIETLDKMEILKDLRINYIQLILRNAAVKGDLKIIKFLAPFKSSYINYYDNVVFRLASQNGHLDVVKFLSTFKNVNPADKNNYAFRLSVKYNRLNVVKFLVTLQGVDPRTDDDFAIKISTFNGNIEMVRFLLTKNINKSVISDYPLRLSIKNGHIEVEKLLREYINSN